MQTKHGSSSIPTVNDQAVGVMVGVSVSGGMIEAGDSGIGVRVGAWYGRKSGSRCMIGTR